MKGTADILGNAAALFIFNDKTVPGPYGLFALDRQLYCKPLRDRVRGDYLVMRFTKKEQEAGLLSSEWRRLKRTIVKLHKEGTL